MPRLTIAIPTLNRADLVARAIESALSQTSPEIEILVSDNGSADTTPAVIARYSDPRLRTFRHEVTMPADKHGQFLIGEARGEFFLGLSDDDFLEPEFAAEVLTVFEDHPECVFVYTGCAVHYENIEVPAVVGPPIEPGLEFLASHYADRREVIWCACATRVQLLRELSPPPAGCVIGDMFFWTQMAVRGPVGCVPRVLSHYILLRENNDNISHGTAPVVWARESRELAERVLAQLHDSGAGPEFLSTLESACSRHIARSVANQFLWTRIRGAGRAEAWQQTIACLPYLSWDLPVVSRLGAALLLPRKLLKHALLRAAAKQGASRSATLS